MTFQTLGYFAEALIFSYIGLGMFKAPKTDWSMSFIGIELVLIVIARVTSVLLVQYIFVILGSEKSLKFKECLFLSYAGMIRGAIAFALVLKIAHDEPDGYSCENCYSKDNYDLVVSTTLMLVMFTTLIFGTFMDKVQKILVPPKDGDLQLSHLDRHASQVTVSMYEEIMHPNEDKSMISDISRRPSYLLGNQNEPASWQTSAFVSWFVKFDEYTLRPFLIRNYTLKNV